MTKDEYSAYLQSPRWRQLSRVLRESVGKCQRCEFPYELNVHHLTYERIGRENVHTDLIVLCKSCHAREHFLEDFERHPELYGTDLEGARRRVAADTEKARRKNVERANEIAQRSEDD